MTLTVTAHPLGGVVLYVVRTFLIHAIMAMAAIEQPAARKKDRPFFRIAQRGGRNKSFHLVFTFTV